MQISVWEDNLKDNFEFDKIYDLNKISAYNNFGEYFYAVYILNDLKILTFSYDKSNFCSITYLFDLNEKLNSKDSFSDLLTNFVSRNNPQKIVDWERFFKELGFQKVILNDASAKNALLEDSGMFNIESTTEGLISSEDFYVFYVLKFSCGESQTWKYPIIFISLNGAEIKERFVVFPSNFTKNEIDFVLKKIS